MKTTTSYIQNLVINWLFIASFVIAIAAIFADSFVFAEVYIVISLLSLVTIVKVYCTKCPVKNNGCAHVLPGKLTRMFPDKTVEKYTTREITITLIGVALILLTPQYWLWQIKGLFGLYWILTIIAGIGITKIICKRCGNYNCVACTNPCKI